LNSDLHWITELQGLLAQQPCVLVTLSQIMGSAPRESGCRMMVCADATYGSIGGGNLEYMATRQARDWLKDATEFRQRLEPFGLGPALNQCCGGAVSLHFELIPTGTPPWLAELNSVVLSNIPAVLATRVDSELPEHWVISAASERPAGLPGDAWNEVQNMIATDANAAITKSIIDIKTEASEWWLESISDKRAGLLLFGAGHVGQEVAHRLRGLPFRLTWADQRPAIFPADAAGHCTLAASDPLAVVAQARANSIFVVMTHSHQLDEEICHAILQRNEPDWDFAWLGLIGSDTKRKRFVHRLRQRGVPESQLQRLVCPIGLAGIHGKQPATIALSLAAQLMMEHSL
jgi:xanthine dehydrogenase accessory factor